MAMKYLQKLISIRYEKGTTKGEGVKLSVSSKKTPMFLISTLKILNLSTPNIVQSIKLE